jgi:hypothetical protein
VNSLEARLAAIQAEQDQNRKNLRVAELVSQLFRENGADPVIVGGSAVEFYTDGTYVSGDVDVCFNGPQLPTPRQRESLLAPIGTSLGVRTWRVADVLVDLLGRVESEARTPFQQLGDLKLIQIEDLIAERILIAAVPQFDEQRWKVAKLLLSVALTSAVQCDRTELERIANSPAYRIGPELARLIDEIESESQNGRRPPA